MIQNFLDKFKAVWTPAHIMANEIAGIPTTDNPPDKIEDYEIAQTLADHLNLILDYKDRLDAFDFLANQAKSNFVDVSYIADSDNLINAINKIGGKDGIVDFALAQEAMSLVLEWMELTAADSIAASYDGKF